MNLQWYSDREKTINEFDCVVEMAIHMPGSDWVDFSYLTTDESDTQSAADDDLEPLRHTDLRKMSADPADEAGGCVFSTALHSLTEDLGESRLRDDSRWLVDCQESAEGWCAGVNGAKLNDSVECQTENEELPLIDLTRRSPGSLLSSITTSSLSSSLSTGCEVAGRVRRPLYTHRQSSLTTSLEHSVPRRASHPARPGGGRVARCLSMPAAPPSTARSPLRHLPERAVRRIHTHYYPEGGWGWCVLGCASALHAAPAGLQPGYGGLSGVVMERFLSTEKQPATPTQMAMTGQCIVRMACFVIEPL